MKIVMYSAREDEIEFFEHFSDVYGVECKVLLHDPWPYNVEEVEGCTCVSVMTNTQVTAEMLDEYYKLGVRFISTRTVGLEHIDVAHAEKLGMGVANVSYTPYSVAEYALMMMLMSLRHMKTMVLRAWGQDYALTGIRGSLLSDKTVGIIGTGKIGSTLAKLLTGFGCKILAYDIWENPALADIVTYVPLDTLLEESDMVTLHAPSSPENYQMMNREAFGKMKKGAVLVNTARGDLVDTEALICALEEGHLGGAALDILDGDRLINYRDKKGEVICHRQRAVLMSLANVIMTPHMAFFTDHSVSDMVEISMRSCTDFCKEKGLF